MMPSDMKNKVLITGGTGLIGTRIIELLTAKGYEIHILSRQKKVDTEKIKFFYWDPNKDQIDAACFEGVTSVINLAGAGVAEKRWSDKRKKAILESRIQSLQLLGKALQQNNIKLNNLVSASAIGYYGSEDVKIFDEEDQQGDDFLASVVVDWEIAAERLQDYFANISKIRIGIVLATEGGAFEKIIQPIKMYVGAPLGSGEQPMSWIHIEDVCNLFIEALEKSWTGNLNAVSGVVTNEELTTASAKYLNRPLILPNVPSFILKLVLGEMSEIVLKGIRVSNKKIVDLGFKPKFDRIDTAIKDLI